MVRFSANTLHLVLSGRMTDSFTPPNAALSHVSKMAEQQLKEGNIPFKSFSVKAPHASALVQ